MFFNQIILLVGPLQGIEGHVLQNLPLFKCSKDDFICQILLYFFLRFEVDKPFKILIKISNIGRYIELDIQNIKAPKIEDQII